MGTNTFYNEILTDHNLYPAHKKPLPGCTCSREGINPSCGDNIVLNLDIEDGVIRDGTFTGSGCAISQASCDIMLDMVIGRTTKEARGLHDTFMKMIRGDASAREIDSLEEAGALQDISHMPARVKCAILGWRTLDEMIGEREG